MIPKLVCFGNLFPPKFFNFELDKVLIGANPNWPIDSAKDIEVIESQYHYDQYKISEKLLRYEILERTTADSAGINFVPDQRGDRTVEKPYGLRASGFLNHLKKQTSVDFSEARTSTALEILLRPRSIPRLIVNLLKTGLLKILIETYYSITAWTKLQLFFDSAIRSVLILSDLHPRASPCSKNSKTPALSARVFEFFDWLSPAVNRM